MQIIMGPIPSLTLQSPITGLIILAAAFILSSISYWKKSLIFIVTLALIVNIYQINLEYFIINRVEIIEIIIAVFGLEVLSALLNRGKFFEVLSKKVLGKTESPYRIFLILNFLTAFLSAILSNVLVLLYMTLIAIRLAECIPELDPADLITSLIISSNLGSMSTLIGDISNIIVGVNAKITFIDFLIIAAPISIISSTISALLIFLRIKTKKRTLGKCSLSLASEGKMEREEKPYLIFGIISMVIMLTLLTLSKRLGLDEGLALGITAIFLLFLGGEKISKVFEEVDWSSMVYLGTLLLSVELVNQVGGLDIIIKATSGADTRLNVYLLSIGLSMFVDDIEAASLLTPVLRALNADRKSWWALVIGSSIGSALTPWGSLANMIALRSVEGRFRMSPLVFIKLSFFAVLPIIPLAYLILSFLG